MVRCACRRDDSSEFKVPYQGGGSIGLSALTPRFFLQHFSSSTYPRIHRTCFRGFRGFDGSHTQSERHPNGDIIVSLPPFVVVASAGRPDMSLMTCCITSKCLSVPYRDIFPERSMSTGISMQTSLTSLEAVSSAKRRSEWHNDTSNPT